MEEKKALELSKAQVGFIRISIVILITIAFYCVLRAFFIEIETPGAGMLSKYADYAYLCMGVSFVLSLPLLIIKAHKLSSFQEQLKNTYGDDDNLKNKAIQQILREQAIKLAPQIIIAVVVSGIIYFILTQYYVTPDVQAEYIRQAHILRNDSIMNYNTDFENITLQDGT